MTTTTKTKQPEMAAAYEIGEYVDKNIEAEGREPVLINRTEIARIIRKHRSPAIKELVDAARELSDEISKQPYASSTPALIRCLAYLQSALKPFKEQS